MAVTGALPGRLGLGRLVSAPGADVDAGPDVAVSGSGITYVAWPQGKRYLWMVAAAARGSFSAPRPLGIPAGAQLQALATGGAGPVAAVWLQYGVHSAPAFRYARLDRHGEVGATTTIAYLGSPLEGVQFAINDSGSVAAGWVNTGKPFGRVPQHQRGAVHRGRALRATADARLPRTDRPGCDRCHHAQRGRHGNGPRHRAAGGRSGRDGSRSARSSPHWRPSG